MWSEDEEEEDVRIESEVDSEMEAMLYAQIHYELPNYLNTTDNQVTDEQSSKLSESNEPAHSSPIRNSIGIKDTNEVETANTTISINQSDLNLEEVFAKKRTKKPKKVKTKFGPKRKQFPEESDLVIGIKKRKSRSVIVISSDDSPRKQSPSKQTSFVTVSFESNKVENRKKSKLGMKNKKKGKPPPDIIELSNSEDDMANAPTSVSLPQDIMLNLQNGRTRPTNIEHSSDTDDFELEKIKANMSDGNWHILDIDRYSAVNNKSRYFKNNRGGMRCSNCQQYGHSTFACPLPIKPVMCIYCGRPNHTSNQCPDVMCGRCWNPGHPSNRCWMTPRMLKIPCTLCRFPGHCEFNCPDYWRRYHLTTTVGPPVPSKEPYKFSERIFCYNCGREGHYGFVCGQPRMYATTHAVCPFVVRYEVPDVHSGQNGIFLPENLRPDAKIRSAQTNLYWKSVHSKRRFQRKQNWRRRNTERQTNGISNNKKEVTSLNNAKTRDRKEKHEKAPKLKKKAKKLFPQSRDYAGEEPPTFKNKKAKKFSGKLKVNVGEEAPNFKSRKAKKRFKLFLKHQEKLRNKHVFFTE